MIHSTHHMLRAGALAALATTGCTGAGVVATNDGGATANPHWTVFVYGLADHNLSPSLETDIAKMSQATLGPNVTVVVEADFDAQRVRAGRTENFPAGTSWFRIRGNNMEPEEILHEAEKNLDDPSELTAGVRYAFSHYPADRYAVILWDHGGGWSGGYGGDGQDGTVAQPAGMSGEAAAAAIRAAMNDLGRTGTRPLEFVAFDTCLMAAPEIIQPFRELASVYIANAEIDFGAGWNYAATLSYIAAHPAATAQTIGAQEVRDWDTLHSAMGVSDVELRSHIAIDLTKFDAFAAAMRTLDDALSATTTPLADVARVGFTTRPQYSISFESDIPAPQFRDLGQFLGALSSMRGAPPSLAQAVGPVQTALNAMTLGVSQGTLRAAAGQGGIHIGLPLPASYTPAVASGYASRAGQWATASHWDRVLTAMTPGGVAAPDIATMGATAINTMSPTASALPTVQIMPRGDVVLGYSTVLAVTADATVFQVREPADEEDLTAGAAASFTWSGQLLQMNGQAISVLSYLRGGVDTTGAAVPSLYAIPGVCSFSGPCQIIFELSASPRAVAVLSSSNGLVSSNTLATVLAQVPGAAFTPLVIQLDGNGRPVAPAMGTPIALTSASIAQVPAPAGRYVLDTNVVDVYGRTSERYDAVTITAPITL